MSYNKHTWATGNVVGAVDLNRMEQGIEDASGGGADSTFTVKFTTDDSGNTYTADKSFEETLAACESFTPINAYLVYENNNIELLQYSAIRKPIIIAEDDIIPGLIRFERTVVYVSDSYMDTTEIALMDDDSVVATKGSFSLTTY